MRNNQSTHLTIPIFDIDDLTLEEEEEIAIFAEEYNLLESEIIYFAGGEAKPKEVLIKREPSYSV